MRQIMMLLQYLSLYSNTGLPFLPLNTGKYWQNIYTRVSYAVHGCSQMKYCYRHDSKDLAVGHYEVHKHDRHGHHSCHYLAEPRQGEKVITHPFPHGWHEMVHRASCCWQSISAGIPWLLSSLFILVKSVDSRLRSHICSKILPRLLPHNLWKLYSKNFGGKIIVHCSLLREFFQV